MSGPDYIFPTDQLTSWDSNGYTKINGYSNQYTKPENISSNINPKSLVTAVTEACKNGGELIAFKQKVNDEWKSWTFKEYYEDIKCVARAFVKLGLEERHSVCISGFNSTEWFLSTMGSIFVGGIVSIKRRDYNIYSGVNEIEICLTDEMIMSSLTGSRIVSN